MRKSENTIWLFFLLIMLNSCFEGDDEIIEDPNNIFSANIEGEEFVLSQKEVCSFPTPCSVRGGISMLFIEDNKLNFHATDVKNNRKFRVNLLIYDVDFPISIVSPDFFYDSDNVEDFHNYASIQHIRENYVTVYTEEMSSYSKADLTHEMLEGNIEIRAFDSENLSFEVQFSGSFKWKKKGVSHGEAYYPYIYPEGTPNLISINNGYFKITESAF